MSDRHALLRLPGFGRPRRASLVAGLVVLTLGAPTAGVRAADPIAAAAQGILRPTIQYEEALAHARDRTVFAPGERVSVPF